MVHVISGMLILSVETITHFLLSPYDVPNGTKLFPDLVAFNPAAALLMSFKVYQQLVAGWCATALLKVIKSNCALAGPFSILLSHVCP